jgi:hypothetical protein
MHSLSRFFITTVAIGAFAVAAQGAAVIDLIDFGWNNFSDDNRERLISRTGGETVIEVGDSIRGVITFNQMFNNALGPQGTLLGGNSPNDELTAIFQIRVAEKTARVGDPLFPWQFRFEPDPAFAAEFGAPAGTMVRVWNDPANNIQLDQTTILISEQTATDGVLFWNLGFSGPGGTAGAGEGWFGVGGDDLSTVANSGEMLGLANFAISRTNNAGVGGDLPLIPLDSIFFGSGAEIIGSSTVRGTLGLNTPWQLASDTTFTVFVIPLPAAAWSALSLLGVLGGTRVFGHLRRRMLAA